ncbi:MAG: hypothetical protein MUF43_13570 [Flavobacterium sp.]|jgi:hypothetical protein|nr:hypothetical protein [Flavobacterium sp.]
MKQEITLTLDSKIIKGFSLPDKDDLINHSFEVLTRITDQNHNIADNIKQKEKYLSQINSPLIKNIKDKQVVLAHYFENSYSEEKDLNFEQEIIHILQNIEHTHFDILLSNITNDDMQQYSQQLGNILDSSKLKITNKNIESCPNNEFSDPNIIFRYSIFLFKKTPKAKKDFGLFFHRETPLS